MFPSTRLTEFRKSDKVLRFIFLFQIGASVFWQCVSIDWPKRSDKQRLKTFIEKSVLLKFVTVLSVQEADELVTLVCSCAVTIRWKEFNQQISFFKVLVIMRKVTLKSASITSFLPPVIISFRNSSKWCNNASKSPEQVLYRMVIIILWNNSWKIWRNFFAGLDCPDKIALNLFRKNFLNI